MNARQMRRFAVVAILPAVVCLLLSCQTQRQPTTQKESKAEKHEKVVESFSGQMTDDGGQHAESIRRFFDEFGPALESGNAQRFGDFFDMRMMLRLLKQQNMVPKAISGDEDRLVQLLNQQLAARLADPMVGISWKKCEVRRVQFIKDDTEAVVYARQWDADDVASKTRWWLLRDGDKWRAYDMEILEVSMRFSVMLGLGFKMADRNDPSVRHVPALMTAVQDGVAGEVESAIETLEQLDRAGFPPVLESLRLMMLAAFYGDELEYGEAIKTADRAMQINSDLPMIHLIYSACYNGLKEHEKAIQHADLYANLLGKDGDYYVELGDAYAGMGEKDKAIKAYQDGLADDAQCGNNVLGLMKIVPADQRDAVVQHYRVLNDADLWFLGFAEQLVKREDPDTLRILIDIHKGVMPDDENISFYEEELAELQREKPP